MEDAHTKTWVLHGSKLLRFLRLTQHVHIWRCNDDDDDDDHDHDHDGDDGDGQLLRVGRQDHFLSSTQSARDSNIRPLPQGFVTNGMDR